MQATDTDLKEIRELILAMDKKADINAARTEEQLKRIEERIEAVDTKLTQQIEAVDIKLTQQIEAVDTKLTRQIEAVDAKLTQQIEAVDIKLTQQIEGVDTKLTQRIDSLDKKMDGLETRMNAQDTRIWSLVVGIVLALFGLLTKLAFFPEIKV